MFCLDSCYIQPMRVSISPRGGFDPLISMDQEFKGSEAWLLAKTCILDQMSRLFYDLLGTCTPWNSFHCPVGCLGVQAAAPWQQPASPADKAGLGRTKPSRRRTTRPATTRPATTTTPATNCPSHRRASPQQGPVENIVPSLRSWQASRRRQSRLQGAQPQTSPHASGPQHPLPGRPRDLGHPPYDPTPGISWKIRISPRLVGKTFKPDFTPQNRIFPTRDPSESLCFEILRRMVFSKPIFVGKMSKINHF